MKTLFALLFVLFVMPVAAHAQSEIAGTWSGNWNPPGGIPNYITIELKQDTTGNVTGKFRIPAEMTFTKSSLNPKTGILAVEAADESGKQYKLEGKFSGTKFIGTLTVDNVKGSVDLAKWILKGS